MNIIVRNAAEHDVAKILSIVNHAIVNTTANYNYEPQTVEDQSEWFEKKMALQLPVIVAEVDGNVVGFGTYGMFREKIGYRFTVEHSVYIDSEFIGKGIGKEILRELIILAKAAGLKVMIGGIDADNKNSIEFHRKFGFEECGVVKSAGYKFGRWLDLMFMQLILR